MKTKRGRKPANSSNFLTPEILKPKLLLVFGFFLPNAVFFLPNAVCLARLCPVDCQQEIRSVGLIRLLVTGILGAAHGLGLRAFRVQGCKCSV